MFTVVSSTLKILNVNLSLRGLKMNFILHSPFSLTVGFWFQRDTFSTKQVLSLLWSTLGEASENGEKNTWDEGFVFF